MIVSPFFNGYVFLPSDISKTIIIRFANQRVLYKRFHTRSHVLTTKNFGTTNTMIMNQTILIEYSTMFISLTSQRYSTSITFNLFHPFSLHIGFSHVFSCLKSSSIILYCTDSLLGLETITVKFFLALENRSKMGGSKVKKLK